MNFGVRIVALQSISNWNFFKEIEQSGAG